MSKKFRIGMVAGMGALLILSGGAMAMDLKSAAFREGGMIPVQYTGQGKDMSPPLSWSAVPKDTKSFALICDDPDAPMGTWVHWVIYAIPAAQRELNEGIAQSATLPDGILQGKNDFGNFGYGGPLPPPGKPHRYFFKLYALDAAIPLSAGMEKAAVEKALKGHILGEARLIGTYQHQ
ncbi:MAG: YbhB/YbcL family Raf kinase inhibitor-like protein [Candidatus Omnitrophica bacterium]|nr:YbhB/YbcL family Raf kinase inhibitor-like protein [Candidatus Omnitrophota bacterium]